MEKKTTHRVIGVLVILALVIIFLPLAFNNNFKSPIQTAELKAPPFPDPQTHVAAHINAVALTASIKKAALAANRNTRQVKEVTAVAEEEHNTTRAANELRRAGLISQVIKHATKENPIMIIGENGEAVQLTANAMRSDLDKAQRILNESKTAQQSLQEKFQPQEPHIVMTNAAMSTTQDPWVVQMGSFKNKANAERMIAKLHAKGYSVFTALSKDNSQLRVYVGPEVKQLAAATLATKITEDTKLHGIVVNFKTLQA